MERKTGEIQRNTLYYWRGWVHGWLVDSSALEEELEEDSELENNGVWINQLSLQQREIWPQLLKPVDNGWFLDKALD